MREVNPPPAPIIALESVASVIAFIFWLIAAVGRWPWPWPFMRPVMRSKVRRRSEAVVVAEPTAAAAAAEPAVSTSALSATVVCGAGSRPSVGFFPMPLPPRHRQLRERAADTGISIAYSPPSLSDRTTTTDPVSRWPCPWLVMAAAAAAASWSSSTQSSNDASSEGSSSPNDSAAVC